MKDNMHPEYGQVVFRDKEADLMFRTGSTLTSDRTIELDGRTYPLIDVQISSASHPFWSGKARMIDTEGRVERFQRRYGKGAGK